MASTTSLLKKSAAGSLATALIVGLVAALPIAPAAAAPAPTTVVVSSITGAPWIRTLSNGATATLVDGPGSPPAGTGSLQMTTGAGGLLSGGKSYVRNSTFTNKPLDSLTTLSYDVYRSSAGTDSGVVRAAFNIAVKSGSTSTTLVYEPVYDGTTTLKSDTWQHYDAFSAKARWWATSPVPGLCTTGAQCRDTFVTWTSMKSTLAALGTTTIVGNGVQVVSGQDSKGSPWAGFIGAVDNVRLAGPDSDVTYDFEARELPTPTTRVVYPSDLSPWSVQNQTTAQTGIDEGPGNPPAGSGSMRISTGPGTGTGPGSGGDVLDPGRVLRRSALQLAHGTEL